MTSSEEVRRWETGDEEFLLLVQVISQRVECWDLDGIDDQEIEKVRSFMNRCINPESTFSASSHFDS